jgi:DNA-binding FadR family transcriptional regulator
LGTVPAERRTSGLRDSANQSPSDEPNARPRLDALAPSAHWTAADHALAFLIDTLRVGGYEVGDRLPTLHELAAEMNLSHVVVRDALDILEQEGIVEIRRGRNGGTYVVAHSGFPSSLQQLYRDQDVSDIPSLIDVRAIIETEIVLRAAAVVGPAELARLRGILVQLEKEQGRAAEFTELTVRLHLLMAIMVGNPMLTNILRDVINRIAAAGLRAARTMPTARQIERGYVLYCSLIEAVETGDRDKIRIHVDEHMRLIADIYHLKWQSPSDLPSSVGAIASPYVKTDRRRKSAGSS